MTTKTKVNDTVARTARGGAQGGVAYSIDVLISSFAHLTNEQFGAILVLLTVVVSAVQIIVENRLGVALLREVPPRPKDVPLVAETPPAKKTAKKTVKKDRGLTELGVLLIVLIVLFALFFGLTAHPLFFLLLLLIVAVLAL